MSHWKPSLVLWSLASNLELQKSIQSIARAIQYFLFLFYSKIIIHCTILPYLFIKFRLNWLSTAEDKGAVSILPLFRSTRTSIIHLYYSAILLYIPSLNWLRELREPKGAISILPFFRLGTGLVSVSLSTHQRLRRSLRAVLQALAKQNGDFPEAVRVRARETGGHAEQAAWPNPSISVAYAYLFACSSDSV